MNCLKCGNPLTPGMSFCNNCGASVSSVSAGVTTMVKGPREAALTALKNPLYLITGIVCLASFVFSMVIAADIIDVLEDVYYYGYGNKSLMFIAVSVMIAVLLPQLLWGVGILVSAAKARSGSSSGIGCVKAGFVTQIVIVSLATALLIFNLIKLLDAMGDYGVSMDSDDTLLLGLCIGIIVIVFIYLVKSVVTFGVVQTAVDRNRCYQKTSVFAVVIGYLLAGSCFYSGALSMDSYAELEKMSGISSILNGLSYALLSTSMILFRKIEISVGSTEGYSSAAFVGGGATPISELGRTSYGICPSCGRALPASGVCSCRYTAPGMTSPSAPVAPVYPVAPVAPAAPVAPTAPATSAVIPETSGERHFCIHCGRVLVGAEVCSCSRTFGSTASMSTAPDPSSVSGGLRSTMRTSRKPMNEKELEDIQKGQSFFGTGGNLD